MSACLFQRARSRAQKAERRAQILAAASTVLESRPLRTITLADISKHLNVSKAAIYSYFTSREAIFLGLYLREVDHFLEQVRKDTDTGPGVADFLVRHLAAMPLLCRLATVLHTILEPSLGVGAARTFKQMLLERLDELAEVLVARFDMEQQSAVRLLLLSHQIVIGAWAAAYPPPAVARVLREPSLEVLKVDFVASLRTQLRGVVASL